MSHSPAYHAKTPDAPLFPQPFNVRSYCPRDYRHVRRLYYEGLLAGHIDPFDPAEDLERIDDFYTRWPNRHFWVAEAVGEVVGTVAVATEDDGIAHLRRLRVAPEFPQRNRLVIALVQTAVAHARECGAVKLCFHTPLDNEKAILVLGDLGFQFARAREFNGRQLLEFYVSLYERLLSRNAKDD